MLLLLRFLRFFQNPKNVTFYVFLLCFIRFLELCRKASNKRTRRLLEHWPRALCVYYCYLFTLRVNSQRLYLLALLKTRNYL